MIDSPCHNCKQRYIGCHDTKSCKEWLIYCAKIAKAREEDKAYKEQVSDVIRRCKELKRR